MNARLKVRGRCPKCGRVVNAEALPGRATWRGECPRKGCDGKVRATRIPDERVDDAPPPEDPPEPTTTRTRKVVKASGYQGRPTGSAGSGNPDVRSTAPEDGGRTTTGSDGRTGTGASDGDTKSEPPRPVKAARHETGATGRSHPYGHLFPGL